MSPEIGYKITPAEDRNKYRIVHRGGVPTTPALLEFLQENHANYLPHVQDEIVRARAFLENGGLIVLNGHIIQRDGTPVTLESYGVPGGIIQVVEAYGLVKANVNSWDEQGVIFPRVNTRSQVMAVAPGLIQRLKHTSTKGEGVLFQIAVDTEEVLPKRFTTPYIHDGVMTAVPLIESLHAGFVRSLENNGLENLFGRNAVIGAVLGDVITSSNGYHNVG